MKRFFALFAIVMLLAAPLSAFAQDGGNPACTGLSEDDCQFLLAAQANVTTANSFAIPSMSLNFNLNDGTTETVLSVTGGGHVMLPDSGKFLVHLVLSDIVIQPSDQPVPSNLEVLVIDNMGYVNYEGEWYGEELSQEDQEGLQEALGMVDSLSATSSLGETGIDLTGVLTTTRGEDVEAMGMTMTAFKTDINITTLLTAVLSSPLLGELLGESGADMGLGELSPEDMQMMGMMFAPMLTGTTISIENWFGAEDQLLHKLVLDLVINIDLSMFGGAEAAPITGAVSLDIDLDQVNETFDVPAPESFKPMDELEGKLEGLSEGLGSLGM